MKDGEVRYYAGEDEYSDKWLELQRITDRLEVLEKGYQAKVDRLASLYTNKLQQDMHTYQAQDEIMQLSTEVDADLNEQYDLRRRMRNLVNVLADWDGKNVK